MTLKNDFDWPPERVLKLRRKLKLTRAQFAKRLGVSRMTVHNWENRDYYKDTKSIIALLDAEKEGEA